MVRLRIPGQLAVFVACLALAGCVRVAAYERGAVARPDMTTSDVNGRAARHATQVHEGAIEGAAAAEAGCGCN
jgi:hypothetical protein